MIRIYNVMYQPRTDDPVIIASYTSSQQATEHLNHINENNPKAGEFHYISIIEEETEEPEWPGQDSGIESFR